MEKVKLKKYKIINLNDKEFLDKNIKNSSNHKIFKTNDINNNIYNKIGGNKTYDGFIDSDYSDLVYNNNSINDT